MTFYIFLHLSTTCSLANSNTLHKKSTSSGENHDSPTPKKTFRQGALPGHLFGMQGVVGDEQRRGQRRQRGELLQPPGGTIGASNGVFFPWFQWIGLRENLQETMDFPMKYGVFL